VGGWSKATANTTLEPPLPIKSFILSPHSSTPLALLFAPHLLCRITLQSLSSDRPLFKSGLRNGCQTLQVRQDEERSDELITPPQVTKTTLARTSVQDAPPSQPPLQCSAIILTRFTIRFAHRSPRGICRLLSPSVERETDGRSVRNRRRVVPGVTRYK